MGKGENDGGECTNKKVDKNILGNCSWVRENVVCILHKKKKY
jgi:hypothetical protein